MKTPKVETSIMDVTENSGIKCGPIEDSDGSKLLEISAEGADPVAAAMLTGVPVPNAKVARQRWRHFVTLLVEGYHTTPETTKLLVRAARNRIIMESVNSGDYKTALEAMKQVGTDTGVFGPQQVELKISAIRDMLEDTSLSMILENPDEEEE